MRSPWGQPFQTVLTYHYDAAHRRIKTRDSLGGVVSSTYDAAGRLAQREWQANYGRQRSVVLDYKADPALLPGQGKLDLVSSINYHAEAQPNESNVVLTTSYGYDPLGRVSMIHAYRGTETFDRLDYQYYSSGMLKQEQRSNDNPNSSFTYYLGTKDLHIIEAAAY